MDYVSEARLDLVMPELATKIRQLSVILQDEFLFLVTQGLRTWDEQAALYAQGRTAPGNIVTNAPPGHSWHNFGMAVDVVPLTQNSPRPDWNINHPQWKRLVSAGESLGLVSGSTFRSFPDWPHFQLTGVLPISPDDNVRQLYTDKGMQAVWAAATLSNPDIDGEISV